jgi:HSP20 family protein
LKLGRASGILDRAARVHDGQAWGVAMDGRRSWMWSEAVEMLARAERLQQELVPGGVSSERPAWEPPADVIETAEEVLIFIALPGVAQENVEALIAGGALIIRGRRTLPPQLRTAVIHRLELPQGYFERRIRLPAGRYDSPTRSVSDGCMVIRLRKAI